MVGDEGFLRNQNEEGEILEHGDLSDFVDVDGAKPATRVVAVGHEDAHVGADGDHGVSVRLVETGGTVDAGSADWVGARLAGEDVFDFSYGAIKRGTMDDDAFGDAGHGIVAERCVGDDSEAEGFCILLEEGCCMSRLGFSDLVTPFLAILCCRGVERVHFGFSKVLDPEGEQ